MILIASEPTLIIQQRSAENRDTGFQHIIYNVHIETPFTIEVQRIPTEIHPCDADYPKDGDGTIIRAAYISWGVWDARSDDWARNAYGADGSHFSSRSEATAWLTENIRAIVA